MVSYIHGIYKARYFWWNLVAADLRSRWRRSFFGVMWSLLQPLGVTALLAVVFSRMFHNDITTYAPYILSGVVFWEFVSASMIGGALSFIQADPYIRQCRHPLAIYSLRTVLVGGVVFMLASIPLYIWTLVVMPQHFGITWIAALAIYPLSMLLAWPLATLLAYVTVRFRDIPHALGLILQALWFLSPVYFEEAMFRKGGLDHLVDYNPVFHLLEIVRRPLLHGEWPDAIHFLHVGFCIVLVTLFTILVGRRAERSVIYYL